MAEETCATEHGGETLTLVVVDMQPAFEACNAATIAAVEEEVKAAMDAGHDIVVLQLPAFHNYLMVIPIEPTLESIRNLIAGYPRAVIKNKYKTSGAEEVIQVCQWKGFAQKRFRVCGVNTDMCVYETVLDLACMFEAERIEVVKKACNTIYEPNPWKMFAHLANVVLV